MCMIKNARDFSWISFIINLSCFFKRLTGRRKSLCLNISRTITKFDYINQIYCVRHFPIKLYFSSQSSSLLLLLEVWKIIMKEVTLMSAVASNVEMHCLNSRNINLAKHICVDFSKSEFINSNIFN